MKRFLFAVAILFMAGSVARAQNPRQESSDYTETKSTYVVLVGTGPAWTAVPSTPTAAGTVGRWAVVCDNLSTNSGKMLWRTSSETGNLPPGNTTQAFTTTPADPPMTLPINGNLQLWFLSLNATPENIYCEEWK